MTYPGHIYRVLGGGVGGRVGQVQVGELLGGQARPDGGSHHVNALVHPVEAHDLGPQDPAGGRVEQGFDRHVLGSGVVSRMGGGVGHHLVIGHPGGLGGPLVEAGGGGRHTEELEDGGALERRNSSGPGRRCGRRQSGPAG